MIQYQQNGYTNACYCYTLAQALTKVLNFEVKGYNIEYKLSEGLKIRLNPKIGAYFKKCGKTEVYPDYNNKLKKIQSLMERTGIYTEIDSTEIYVTIPDNMRDSVLLLLQLMKSDN